MIHILPVKDEREHVKVASCWCNPKLDKLDAEGPEMILIHNSTRDLKLVKEVIDNEGE